MTGASSCGRCRGTGAVRMTEIGLPDPAPPAETISPEIREIVEEEYLASAPASRLKLKGRHVKLSAGSRRGGKGLSFKH
jgi:hypothetical protein